MSRIALLIQPTPTIEDGNYFRFGRALSVRGHTVDLVNIDTLRLLAGRVSADSFPWRDSLSPGDSFPDQTRLAIDHDIVWLLGLGERTNFLDKYQLLYALPKACTVINSLNAIMHLKSKYFLASQGDEFPNPETHASTSAQELINIVRASKEKWIIKPPAGSLGVDVYLTHAGDDALETTIKRLCGPANNRYTLLQKYLPEIEQGEKRVLLAGGKVAGQYLRRANGDHRTNLSVGATIEPCGLSDAESAYCGRLANQLLLRGARFAGIDLAFPWLIEVNVINPGGITTIHELTGQDLSAGIIDAVISSISKA